MKKITVVLFLVFAAFTSAAEASSGISFQCSVVKIYDEDFVSYFELEEGATIQGSFRGKNKKIKLGSLSYSGDEVSLTGKDPVYKVWFNDVETGSWLFIVDYKSGAGYLRHKSKANTLVLADCDL